MQFPLLSLYEAARSISAAVVTLVMAYMGYGYWALVWGNVIGTFLRCVLVARRKPVRFAKPVLSKIREPLMFGWHVLVSIVALNSYERLDNVTAGRVLGRSALGIYAMAWNLAYVPLEKVTSLVTIVLPSYFSAVQHDLVALRRYVRTLTEGLALATFPATIGLGLVARELVPIAFGKKWVGVIAPLEVLSVFVAVRSIVPVLSRVLTAIGNARFVMWNDLAALCFLPIAFYIGSHWGVTGIAWAWVVAYPFVASRLCIKALKTIKMTFREYFQALRPALDGTIAMALVVIALKMGLSQSVPLLVRLILEVACGRNSGATVFLNTRKVAFVRAASHWEGARGASRKIYCRRFDPFPVGKGARFGPCTNCPHHAPALNQWQTGNSPPHRDAASLSNSPVSVSTEDGKAVQSFCLFESRGFV
jgi:PST family polysaccharide transporter